MGILRVNQVSGDETQLSTLGIGTTTPVTGSVLFDGNGDYLELVDSEDWYFGSGNFTVEGWFYYTGSNERVYFYSQVESFASNNNRFQMYYSGSNWTIFYANASGTTTINISAADTLVSNTWVHIAFVKEGTTYRIFRNGILLGSGTDTDEAPSLAAKVYVGTARDDGTQKYFQGYISNLRVLKGTALYTANFTPPRTILEPIQDTVLLCCNNPDSAGAVSLAGIGTSKTITVNGNAVASTFNPGLVRNFTYGTQFTGVTKFDTQGYFVPPSGTTEQRNRGRGIFMGGFSPATNVIDFVNISASGNAIDFGDLSFTTKRGSGSPSSSTRGINGGGLGGPAITNTIEYITISSTSNSQDFGDLTAAKDAIGSCSNQTRGLFGGGVTPVSTNAIEFITIASLGNASSFGNLSAANNNQSRGLNSPTRGLFAGGTTNVIEFVNFATLGAAQDFGDISVGTVELLGACSSSTRGCLIGGELQPTGTLINSISFITFTSTGNSINFGELSVNTRQIAGTSNSIRGVFGGGLAPTAVNTISFVTIASTGNAQDFGDLTQQRSNISACSDSHGGIS